MHYHLLLPSANHCPLWWGMLANRQEAMAWWQWPVVSQSGHRKCSSSARRAYSPPGSRWIVSNRNGPLQQQQCGGPMWTPPWTVARRMAANDGMSTVICPHPRGMIRCPSRTCATETAVAVVMKWSHSHWSTPVPDRSSRDGSRSQCCPIG